MIEPYIVAEDRRYPTLVIETEEGFQCYNLNLDTYELTRVCGCVARNEDDCICGGY